MKRFIVLAGLCSLSLQAYAVSPQGQRDINQIASGNVSSIRSAAKHMYRRGERDTTVLDALAESMLQNYTLPGRTAQDAVAWGCKALGVSGNGRYRTVLSTVIEKGPNAKTAQHCRGALGDLPKAKTAQYKKGMSSVKQPPVSAKPKVTNKGVSAIGQQNIDQMVNGGPSSLRSAAKSIYRRGEKNTKVLDTLAEVMFRESQSASDLSQDAVAWGCKALGQSNNSRYYKTIKTINEQGSAKVQKHCRAALAGIPKPTSNKNQYTKGKTSLKPLKAQAQKNAAKKAEKVVAKSGKLPITEVQEGMTMDEVYNLIGTPTSTNSHITGKAWKPFNYRGADTVRTHAYYKGQGRIVFSQRSRYASTWYVREIHINPNETGYP